MTTTNPEPQAATLPVEEASSESENLASRAIHLAKYIEGARPGLRAELRRMGMHPDRVAPPAFWDLVARIKIPRHEESFWQAVAPLMVTLPHGKAGRLGRQLAEAKVSPRRVEGWLARTSMEDVVRGARDVLAKLDGKRVNWATLALLLFTWTDERRRVVARDFFTHPNNRS